MARRNEFARTRGADKTDADAYLWRHWGDGGVGQSVNARLQGYNPLGPAYVDVQVDADGVVAVSGGGGGGGGAVTIADGADVAQGTTTDVAWVSGAGTVISLLKKIASAGGSAVSIADGSDVVEGALADAAIITDTTGTVNGKLRGLVKHAYERMPASLGQKAMTASFPVVFASDQSSIPVTGTFWQATQPVSGPLTDVQLRASAVPVSLTSTTITGSVAVTNAALSVVGGGVELTAQRVTIASDSTGLLSVDDNGSSLTVDAPVATPVFVRLSDGAAAIATLPVSLTSTTITGTVAVTSTQLPAALAAGGGLKVEGVAGGVAQPVTMTSTTITGSVAVTGPLTDVQLRASVVPVSLTSTTITGSVAVTGPLTDTQLRASAVPVSLTSTTITGTVTVSGTVAVTTSNYRGRTVTQVLVNQGAAGTTVIAAASASNKHKIIGGMLTMTATGTLKFLDGAGDLTGAMDFSTTGGFLGSPSPDAPYLQTSVVNSALSITTVTGAARGWLLVVTEP